MGSGGRISLIGKRLLVRMVKRQKSMAMVKREKAHKEEMVKDLMRGNATYLEEQERYLIIGCSDKILLTMFW